ncbi:MAG: hypothetical protein PHQ86_09290 [Dehalococcoidales bacterium]|nr:hypothetical protein [Dehalococcoidales bacterium]
MVNENIVWTDDMGQVSSFGGLTAEGLNGFYELSCRQLVFAGLDWLSKQKRKDFDIELESVGKLFVIIGVPEAKNRLGKKLLNYLTNYPDIDGLTGGQLTAAIQVIRFITNDGWDTFKSEMIRAIKGAKIRPVDRKGFVCDLVLFGADHFDRQKEKFDQSIYRKQIYTEQIPSSSEIMDDAREYAKIASIVHNDFKAYCANPRPLFAK